jgi:transposase-like protein
MVDSAKVVYLSLQGDAQVARKSYTPEFKLQAVKMILEQKIPVAEVARRLGVAENLLHSWKKAVLQNGAQASGPIGPPTDSFVAIPKSKPPHAKSWRS